MIMMIFRHYFLFLFVVSLTFAACDSENSNSVTAPYNSTLTNEVKNTMQQLWETTPIAVNIVRQNVFAKIQGYADICPASYFKNYLNSLDVACESLEKTDAVLGCYRYAFDRVLKEVKNEQVEKGKVVIWMLYNMGDVV